MVVILYQIIGACQVEKIISLFKRDYQGTGQVYNEVVEGAEWVQAGEGIATVKIDGTCCKIEDNKLYKRYDRKLTKAANKRKRAGDFVPTVDDFKPAPENWQAAEDAPNKNTGHWPGWVPVGDEPESKWHREGYENFYNLWGRGNPCVLPDGTYELVGPKVQGNPYGYDSHLLLRHGIAHMSRFTDPPRDFEGLKQYLSDHSLEGIVWHHSDGRMVKIKRRDFGLEWPIKERD